MAALCKFDENDKLFTAFCEPNMGYTSRLFYTFHPKKGYKEWLLIKMPK
jgi:hypothetical protein